MKAHPVVKDQLTKIYGDAHLKKNFDALIRINVSVIMQKNILRIGKDR